jgi:hypothetical protein
LEEKLMCCFFTILVFLGPRFAGIIWWIYQPLRWVGVAGAFDTWLWPLLGLVFLPWTTLMFVSVSPLGITGLDWLWLGLAIFIDIAGYSGGAYGNRDRMGYGSS